MRIVHTSDWHLGKRLFEASLLEEQAHVLGQIHDVCKDERADALIVAGDLYDRAVPPVEAVALLGDFVGRVAGELGIPIVAISGNHDSADRLGFAAELLERGKVHLRTTLERRADPVVLERGRDRLSIFCLPYLEPEQARARIDASVVDHGGAVVASLAAMNEARARGGDAVLVAHLYAAGGQESPESERPLLVGGASAVPDTALAAGRYSYVALGHLHQAQLVGERADIRYSGSPYKYSFGEAAHEKSVTVVELVCGRPAVRTVPLTPRRDVMRIEGTFEELLRGPEHAAAERAFVQAIYTDGGYVLDAAARLRQRFPHLLQVLPKAAVVQAAQVMAPRPVPRGGDARALLSAFWATVENEEAPPQLLDELERALEQMRRKAAESCALAS